jgi:hypothetical protein
MAIVLKPNLPMLRGILTGSVSLDYATHRHPLWITELEGAENADQMAPLASPTEEAPESEQAPAPCDTAIEQISGGVSAVDKESPPPAADHATETKT